MKFYSYLTEATLLKRTLNFLIEASLVGKQRVMLRCPNLGQLEECDILGTKIWYSNPIGLNCLPTWELVEIDEGHLVSINAELLDSVVNEAISLGNIAGLESFILKERLNHFHQLEPTNKLVLAKENELCYVAMEHLISERPGMRGVEQLQFLLQAREQGYRAALLFCVMHTGVNFVQLNNCQDLQYAKLFAECVASGVEILAYKATITLQNIELINPVSVLYPEKTLLR